MARIDERLSPEEEQRFLLDYLRLAAVMGLSANPDDGLHFYDYRGAWRAGKMRPGPDMHLPSEFKRFGHPDRFIDGVDTITGRKATAEAIRENDEIRRRVIRRLGRNDF
jgi:hypothetical protein